MIEDDIFKKACDIMEESGERACMIVTYVNEWFVAILTIAIELVMLLPFFVALKMVKLVRKLRGFVTSWIRSDDILGRR